MQTRQIKNAYKDWQVTTIIDLSEDYQLEVLTMKRFNGKFTTSASVFKLEKGSKTHVPLGQNRDFSKQIQTEKFRGTEKAVRQFHDKVNFEELVKEAKEFHKIP